MFPLRLAMSEETVVEKLIWSLFDLMWLPEIVGCRLVGEFEVLVKVKWRGKESEKLSLLIAWTPYSVNIQQISIESLLGT